MRRQIDTWLRMVDTIFAWVEDLPVASGSLVALRRALDEVASEHRKPA
jgi:hypothetical protein